MKIAVMQPYFFPYIGYFQLIQAVDAFIIYDDIKYTKKGWINRNRILAGEEDRLISLPLMNASDSLTIRQRTLSSNWQKEKVKILNVVKECYRKAPFYEPTIHLLQQCLEHPKNNLFEFIRHSLMLTCDYMGIETPLVVSSSLEFENSLKSSEKVIAICRAKNCTNYINPIGGLNLYDKDEFRRSGVALNFLKTKAFRYPQFSGEFVAHLSIIDVMMFNAPQKIGDFLREEYDIL